MLTLPLTTAPSPLTSANTLHRPRLALLSTLSLREALDQDALGLGQGHGEASPRIFISLSQADRCVAVSARRYLPRRAVPVPNQVVKNAAIHLDKHPLE